MKIARSGEKIDSYLPPRNSQGGQSHRMQVPERSCQSQLRKRQESPIQKFGMSRPSQSRSAKLQQVQPAPLQPGVRTDLSGRLARNWLSESHSGLDRLEEGAAPEFYAVVD